MSNLKILPILCFLLVGTMLAGCSKKTTEAEAKAKAEALVGGMLEKAGEKKADEKKVEAAPAKKDMTEEEIAEAGVKMFVQIAEATEANKDDCDKMAVAWNKVFDDNADLKTKMDSLDKKQSAEQKAAFDKKHKATIEGAMKKMMGGMMKCKDNAAMKKAAKRME